MAPLPTAAHHRDLDDLLSRRAVRSVYQPIVRLRDGAVVGYEALARGPVGSPLERPDAMFGTAWDADRVAELDHCCRAAAFSGALAAGLDPNLWLSVNVEPASLGAPVPNDLAWAAAQAEGRLSIVVEITERMLTSNPAGLLELVAQARRRGWRVALDDVGADPLSLALMPVLQPEVIKLDLRVVQQRPSLEVARLFSAVNAEAERSGAVVLAEGIETPDHLDTAIALGATLGQGWMLGHPAPLPRTAVAPRPLQPLPFHATESEALTPFDLCQSRRELGTASKALMVEVSKHLEREAAALGRPAMLLAAFEQAHHFTPETAVRYEQLGRQLGYVAALARDMPEAPVTGVRGAALAADDRLATEWTVAVLGPHLAAALVARDLGDRGPDMQRRFAYVLTYDRELVRRVATAMLHRVPRSDPSAITAGTALATADAR